MWDTNLSNICTFKIVVLMNMMAYNSFKILVHYGEFNEVIFVSMTRHQVIHCTAVALHTFLQQAIHWNVVNTACVLVCRKLILTSNSVTYEAAIMIVINRRNVIAKGT
jgi:hypothetical protein